jgi:transposase-like protein
MKASEFSQLKQSVNSLSPKQKTDLEKYLLDPKSQPQVIKFLEQALDGCPHCQHDAAYKWGTSKGRQRYRCRSCGKTYNAFTGSVLNGLQKPEVWEQYCQTMVDSKSLRAAAKECGINLTTAFNWRHRFLKLTDSLMSKQLEGIAEMDETQFKYSEKGSRQLTADKPRKRGSDKAPKVKVVIGIDRSGHVVDDVVGHFTLAQLKANFLPKFSGDVVLCTDGHINYEYLAKQEKINHVVLNQSLGERVKEKGFHIQTVNGYHMRLKQWLAPFHGVATQNLHKYVGWFRWFELNKHGNLSPTNFMKDMLCRAFQQLRQT